MSRWLRRFFAACTTLVALFLLVGLLLPGEWRVERTRLVKAPPKVVTTLLHTRVGWKRWMAWVKTVDPAFTFTPGAGPDRGVGMDFSWTGGEKVRAGRMVLDAWVAEQRVGYTQTFEEPLLIFHGELRVTAKDGGTELRWTETTDVGLNPVGRWLGVLGDQAREQEMDQGLDALQAIVESDAVEAAILDGLNNPAP